ncbi:hypothetical protein DFS34DRAFT_496078 [Phlyctochytrium arcticum]|nr:hypothetical protein DFS34DRAFT_496078 [Phlyctochytrium arcticum]
MLPFQKQFPALKRVPDTSLSALSFEDRFDLYTFVEFWNRYAERLFQLNYEATTLTYAQLEYYITNPDLEFEKVASFYVAFIKVMWPALQTNIGTVQARLAYTFTESDGHDLHTTFKTFQWRDIPPKTHVRALMTLLQVLLETEDFREVMRTIKEHLQEMRTNRWVGLMRRKEVKAIIENLDKEILDHDHQIAQTDNDRASSETAKDSEDAEGSDWASRGGTAVRRQVEKDKQDKVRKQSAEKRLAAAKLVKERNILVTKLHKSQAELAKLERDEEEWQSKYDVVFDQVTATHKRRIGLDRLGRMYWLMEIRKRPAVAVEADAEAAVDSLPKDEAEPVANEGEAELAEQFKSPSNSPRRAKNSKGKEPAIVEEPDIVGIIIEDTKYEWHSEPVAILPMFDRTNGGRKDNVPDSCQNISLPPPPPKVTAKLKVDFHYIDSVSLLTRLFRALNPLGLREKELRNGLKSFFPDVLESTLKTTTKTREADRILKAFGKWVEGKVVGPPDEIQSQREPIAEGVKKAAKGSQEVMKEYVTDTITYFAQSCDMANDDERIANVLNLLFPATTTPTLPTEEQPTEEQPAEEQPTSTEAAAAPTQSLSEALKAAMDAMHSWLTAIPTLTPEAITKAEQVPTLSSLAAWCADIQDEIDRERANRAALEKKSGRRDKRKTPVSATSSPALAVTAVAGDDVKGSSDLEGSAKGSSSTRGTRGTRGTRSSGRRVVGKYNELDDAEFAALIDDDKPEEVKTRPTRSRGNTHGRYRIDSDSGGDEDLGERRRSSRLRAITPTQTSAIRDSSSSDIDLETLQRRRMLRAAAAAGESQSPKAPTNGSAVEEQFGQVSENDDDADSMATKSTTHDPMEIDSTPSTPPVVRRPRGRPRKNPIKDIEVLESPSVQESEPPIVQEEQPQEVRRGRARQPPPSVQEEQPQEVRRPRGRPRKHPIKDVQVSEPPSAPSAPSSVQEEDVETDTEELEAEEEYSEELEEEDDEIPEEEEDDDD